MAKIWTILANSNTCRIYDYDKQNKKLKLIKELLHPSSKLKGIDLITDKPGRYQTPRTARSAYEPNLNPQEIEIQRFATQIARELELGKNTQQYENLVLIIPAQMSGLIHASINRNVQNSIMENIHKDYLHLSEPDIVETLQDALRRPKY